MWVPTVAVHVGAHGDAVHVGAHGCGARGCPRRCGACGANDDSWHDVEGNRDDDCVMLPNGICVM